MVRQQLFIGAALLAGVAIGFFVQPEPEKEPVPEKPKTQSAVIDDVGESAALAALRARVRELEAQLAASRDEGKAVVSNAVAHLEEPRGNWIEALKKSDPARFTQMTNWFAQIRSERKSRQAARAEFLSSVGTSHMSAEAQKTHAAYQELLARREELEERIHQEGLDDAERQELMREMRGVSREMRELGLAERQVLLGEVAYAIGLEGEAAAELVETVGDVIEVTEGASMYGGHRGPPPPPGGPSRGR